MRIDYSKPSADIAKESAGRIKNEKQLFEEQKKTSVLLLKCKDRKVCIVCNSPLTGEKFDHRGIPFINCKTCGHIQTRAMPPKGYPMSVKNGLNFKKIYPKLKKSDYEDRKKRIYKPKLDWVISCLNELGYSSKELQKLKWAEMGCGAGYFLSALKDAGMKNIGGFDADKALVKNGNEYLGGNRIHHFSGELEKSLALFPADVYVSFFVLEHLDSSFNFFEAFRKLKPGTIFIFSVPVFGFSCLLENIFQDNYARNLDAVIHTQIFTDRSINYAMHRAGFSIETQWLFGQDSTDFTRIITHSLKNKYPASFAKDLEKRIVQLTDPFQSLLDKNKFSDQRHIIAIKN